MPHKRKLIETSYDFVDGGGCEIALRIRPGGDPAKETVILLRRALLQSGGVAFVPYADKETHGPGLWELEDVGVALYVPNVLTAEAVPEEALEGDEAAAPPAETPVHHAPTVHETPGYMFTVHLEKEMETPGTFRYAEDDPAPRLGQLYIKKAFLPIPPQRLQVDVRQSPFSGLCFVCRTDSEQLLRTEMGDVCPACR